MFEQLSEVLKGLKWTDYDIMVYAKLVEKGSLSPQELVYETDVPSGRIYDVLKSLEKRGAVMEVENKPKIFDAQNPRMVLYGEVNQIEKKIEKALPSAEQSWEKRANPINNNETGWTVRGSKGIVTQLRVLMQESSTSLIISDKDISWLGKKDYRIIKKFATTKKDLRILSSASFAEELEDLSSLGIDVRIGNKFSDCYIINKSTAMIKLGNPPSGIVIKDKNFVDKILDDFEKDFKVSKKVESAEIVS